MFIRPLLVLLLLASAGCATYETRHVYDDGYYSSHAYDEVAGSRYAPAYDGYGDYYVGRPAYRYVDSYYYPGYLEWPAYYSLFWGFNRWYHDPFYYPGYYYGITYYPHNYLSFSAHRGLWAFGVEHRHFPYSPYLHAWNDHYFDWSYWYQRYPSHRYHYQAPRFGSARNEAERLAWQSRSSDSRAASRGPRHSAASDSLMRRGEFPNRVQARQDARQRALNQRAAQRQASSPTARHETKPSLHQQHPRQTDRRGQDERRTVQAGATERRQASYTPRSVERAASERSGETTRQAATRSSTPGQSAPIRSTADRSVGTPRPVAPARAYRGDGRTYSKPLPATRQARVEPDYRRAAPQSSAAPVRQSSYTQRAQPMPVPSNAPRQASQAMPSRGAYAAPPPAQRAAPEARSNSGRASSRSESRRNSRGERDDD